MARFAGWLLLFPALLSAQAGARRGFALVDADGDTLAVERWTLRGERTEVLITSDGWPWFHLLADTDPESGTERLAFTSYDPAPDGIAGLSFSHEVVVLGRVATVRDAVTGEITERLAVPFGTVAYFPASLALLERRLLRTGVPVHLDQPIRMPVLVVGPTGVLPDTLRVDPVGGDSAATHVLWHDLVIARDGEGRIVGARSNDVGSRLRYVPLDPVALDAPWPPVPTNYFAERGAPFRTEEARITVRDGVTLAGTLTLPLADGPVPALLLLSGSGAQDRDGGTMSGYRPLREIAEALAGAGVATLRLDDRGVGGSGGDYATMTIADLASDARTALTWLGGDSRIDARRLGLLGHSEGALVAMQALADGAPASLLVAMAGSSRPGREIVAAQQRYGVDRFVRDVPADRRQAVADSLLGDAALAVGALARESAPLRFFLRFDPRATARGLRVPALVLQGETDRQVPSAQADELAAALARRGAPVAVRHFPGTDHLFLADDVGDPGLYLTLPSRELRGEVLDALVGWVGERTASRPRP